MALVVDTDVVSFFHKKDTRAALYQSHLNGHMLIISFMTLVELERWTLSANWGPRRRQGLFNYLRRYLVHHSSPSLCRRWAEVGAHSRRTGGNIGLADAWIAATALSFNVSLVTHNASDYAGVPNLTVISEP